MMLRLGIDLGGTKVELIALDEQGETVLRKRIPTPSGDYTATVNAISGLVGDATQTLACAPGTYSIGIGIPGTLSAETGLVKNANSTCLIGQPLQRDLEVALGQPIRIANDADCFALSEATDGAGAGYGIVFGVILGTGVGGGLVINKNIVRGPNAITGEWGHNPLPWPDANNGEWPGPLCYCGKTGCLETFLSGPGMFNDAITQQTKTAWASPADIAAAAEEGQPDAQSCMQRYYSRLARGLASVINVVDPDVIVLGGGLSNILTLYNEVPKRWQEYVFSDSVLTKLAQNVHGDSGGVRGAAWLWPNKT